MSEDPSADTQLNRRQLLASVGMTAVAGCPSDQGHDPSNDFDSTNAETSNSVQPNCIDESEYQRLQNQYEELRGQYQTLRSRAQNSRSPPYIITNRRRITVTYETLTGDYDSWEWDSSALTGQNTAGNFAREMTYSQLEYLGWDIFGFEGDSKYTQLGNFGRYYQLTPFVVASNFTPLAEAIYDRHQSDQRRIRGAWNFVTQLNSYVSEITETPRFPLETLLLGGGDCEDSAILLGSLLYAMSEDYEPEFWYIDAENPTDPQTINHVIVSAEIDDGSLLIETTSDTMSPFDEVNGFSVTIEPSEFSR